MLMIGYCYSIRSERRLCQEVEMNLAYRWFCRRRPTTAGSLWDMMDKPDGLPTSPQAQQQQQNVINRILAA